MRAGDRAEQQPVGTVSGRDDHVVVTGKPPDDRRVVDAHRAEADPHLAQRRRREAGHDAQRLAQHFVHAARGDGGIEPGFLDRGADRDARVGPRNHVVPEHRLHDRPRAGVVSVDTEVHDLPAHRTDRQRDAESVAERARPGPTRDDTASVSISTPSTIAACAATSSIAPVRTSTPSPLPRRAVPTRACDRRRVPHPRARAHASRRRGRAPSRARRRRVISVAAGARAAIHSNAGTSLSRVASLRMPQRAQPVSPARFGIRVS